MTTCPLLVEIHLMDNPWNMFWGKNLLPQSQRSTELEERTLEDLLLDDSSKFKSNYSISVTNSLFPSPSTLFTTWTIIRRPGWSSGIDCCVQLCPLNWVVKPFEERQPFGRKDQITTCVIKFNGNFLLHWIRPPLPPMMMMIDRWLLWHWRLLRVYLHTIGGPVVHPTPFHCLSLSGGSCPESGFLIPRVHSLRLTIRPVGDWWASFSQSNQSNGFWRPLSGNYEQREKGTFCRKISDDRIN